MPRQKGVSQLEVLRRKQAELAEQLKAAEARERERDKQIEVRRREIVGAVIVEQLKAEPESPLAKSVLELVAQKLTRPADRALFPNLLPLRPERASPEIAPMDGPALPGQMADAAGQTL